MVVLAHQLEDFRLFEVEPERPQRDLELVVVDLLVLVEVKELERLADLLLLVWRELRRS